jgi:hypothetical protein
VALVDLGADPDETRRNLLDTEIEMIHLPKLARHETLQLGGGHSRH